MFLEKVHSQPNTHSQTDKHTWKFQLKNFITAAGITSDARKRATLLNEGGKELTEVVEGLEHPGNNTRIKELRKITNL